MTHLSQQFISIQLVGSRPQPRVYFGIAIDKADGTKCVHISRQSGIPQLTNDDNPYELFLPVGCQIGDLEDLRTQVLQQVNDIFDAARS